MKFYKVQAIPISTDNVEIAYNFIWGQRRYTVDDTPGMGMLLFFGKFKFGKIAKAIKIIIRGGLLLCKYKFTVQKVHEVLFPPIYLCAPKSSSQSLIK
jgi:hypothetical protein